ncbi:Hypothetical predicted protein [Lecanosticta acicola]|uniref:Uncharacterized protein n=1 Tax=Lecanosticta acicola TaxID=111012 RepID=A0AAI8W185_9PEZI|nr:Hypothetical predicted protein [Lecanosticta acicola]
MGSDTGTQPPSYSTVDKTSPDEFLTRIMDHTAQERSGPITPAIEREATRVKNFMVFMLSVDYKCNSSSKLSAIDREHFTTMHSYLLDLDKAHGIIMPSPSERHELASYFWQYLHEPCKYLHLPVESVLDAMGNLTKYTTARGRYKGCCFGVIQAAGLERLAQKLYLDIQIVMPRTIDDQQLRQKFVRAIDEVRAIYFQKITGIEAATMDLEWNNRKWCVLQNISYEMNDRGRTYESQRSGAIRDAARSAEFSVCHWKKKVGGCIGDILHRRQRVEAGQLAADHFYPTVINYEDGTKKPFGTSTKSWPRNWGYILSQFLPDYFENRSGTQQTDA